MSPFENYGNYAILTFINKMTLALPRVNWYCLEFLAFVYKQQGPNLSAMSLITPFCLRICRDANVSFLRMFARSRIYDVRHMKKFSINAFSKKRTISQKFNLYSIDHSAGFI